MTLDFNILDYEEFRRLVLEYKEINNFVINHQNIAYIDFDYYVVSDVTLFTIEPYIDLRQVESTADGVIKSLTSLKKIFAKPVLHLIESSHVLPVESVHTINNSTILHIVNHSELWNNIKDGNIEPLKLLTKTYKDNYSIYENIIFCTLIDEILLFTRSSQRFLKNLIYTNQTIELNLLERVNHVNYFLALGKLHTGYIRSFNRIYSSAKPCLHKLTYIYNSLVPRLKSPVYRLNKVRPKKINLHKTNILAMHKDYQKVYRLLKHFNDINAEKKIDYTIEDYQKTFSNYFYYCELLTIFALGHFNFKCSEKARLNFSFLKQDFAFKNWKVTVQSCFSVDQKCLLLAVKSDQIYRIVLIPSLEKDNGDRIERIKAECQADEYLILSPYEDMSSAEGFCYISISNVESFRRLQRLILRGMIYSDTKKKACPFCSEGQLEIVSSKFQLEKIYECEACRTQIAENICAENGQKYFTSGIANYFPRFIDKSPYNQDDTWLYLRLIEGQMFFRNITDIDENADPICPVCGSVHKKNK